MQAAQSANGKPFNWIRSSIVYVLGDEFYYVPNGRVPTTTQGTTPLPQEVTLADGVDITDATDGQFTDGQNTHGTDTSKKFNDASGNEAEDVDTMDYLNRKQRRRKSRTKQPIEIPQPVLIGPYPGNSRKIVFIPGMNNISVFVSYRKSIQNQFDEKRVEIDFDTVLK